MFSYILQKIKTANSWYLLFMAVVLSEVFTAVMNIAAGLLLWGRIDPHLLLIGSVDAFVVGLLVTLIITRIISDVSKCEKQRGELQKRAHIQLETLINSVPDMVFFKDMDGRNLVVNRAHEDFMGLAAGESLGKTVEELLPPDLAESCRKSDEEVMRFGRAVRAEEMTMRAGEKIFLDSIKVPLYDEKGNCSGIVGIVRDITERKSREAALHQRENQNKAILNNIPDIAWLKDSESRFIAVNEAFGRACGLSPSFIAGKSDLDIWPEDLASRYRADDMEVMLTGKRKQVEEPLPGRDGSTLWIETIKTPVYDDKGNVIGTTGIARDITGRKRAEDAIIESEEKLRTLFDSASDAMFILDPDGNFADVNRVAYERLGYEKEELLSMHISELDPPDFAARVPERLEQSKKTGNLAFESSHKRKDGTIMPVEINSRLIDLQGRKMMFSVVRDITERKRVEAELKMHRENLERLVEERTADFGTAINFLRDEIEVRKAAEETLKKNEVKMRQLHAMKVLGELAAGVAHEVRNPLHALMSVTEALNVELSGNPDFEIYLFHIKKQVERLSTLMKDLLDLGKPIEPSNLRPEVLADICLSSIDLWKNSPSRRDHSISFVRPEDGKKLVVTGDSQRLQQVFLNLLENASNHSPEGSEIKVLISANGENARVNVTDSGSGIPEELLPRIFEPFFSTRKGGTGLGLSIIKNILEGHGGGIAIRNNGPIPGCTAEVILPLTGEAIQ